MDKFKSSSSEQQNQIEEKETTIKSFNSFGISLKPIDIQESREREKRELTHLNDRFASYIERVRFLEAHNKKLQLEIDGLRGNWGLQTNKIKEKYAIEIHQARHILDDTTKDRAAIDLRVKRAEEERLKLKEKYELLLAGRDSNREKIQLLEKQLFNNQADVHLFHRRLIDLEDEQKRYNTKSHTLISDLQRLTKDLDHETITRIHLENEKQSLKEEIQFLKDIHLQDIEEVKQMNLIDTTLDPTNFFQNELTNAVRNIREEYEQLNQQQRNEFQSWYQIKVTEAIQEIQSHRAIEKSENIREQEEIKKLRKLVTDSGHDIVTMRQRNGELENRIRELENLIDIERNDNIHRSEERDRKIKDLRIHFEDLGRNYDELISTKSSLDSEIAIYRKLLEGEEERKGLKQIADHIEEQAQMNSSITDKSATYSRSYHRTNGNQESEERSSTNNERIPSAVHQQSIRLRHQSDSSDRGTDYDSSIEDPNERLLSFQKKN